MSFQRTGMCGAKVLFSLVLLKTLSEELSEALSQFPRSDEVSFAIESFEYNSMMRKFGNWLSNRKRGDWSRKNPTESNILHGKFMFGTFSNTVEKNEHAEWIGTDYDVDPNSWSHDRQVQALRRCDVFRELYTILTRFDKYFVNDRSINAIDKPVAIRRSSRNLGSVTHGLHFANGDGAILERRRHWVSDSEINIETNQGACKRWQKIYEANKLARARSRARF